MDELAKKKSGSITLSKETLNIIRRNTHRLKRLINQLLDISKLEAGNVSLRVSEGNLAGFVRAIVLSFLSLAESKQIDYEYEIPDALRKNYFDPDKLEKILTNLISNAFKYTSSGGKVKVNLQYSPPLDEADEDSTGSGPPEFAEITVSDSGKGIPADKIDKIFDRFYRTSDSDTQEEEGTGIGLALTRELVDLYRGKITVESEVDKGSTFRISLPVSREQFREEEVTEPLTSDLTGEESAATGQIIQSEDAFAVKDGVPEIITDGSPGSSSAVKSDAPLILIVEDNVDLRNYIAGSLGGYYEIRMAGNGILGLESALESIPDLVISDVMMPEMDGMEMCGKLKKDERTCHIPVIMLTAKSDKGSKMEGLETGADDYLIKPFDPDELRIRVRNLVEQRKRLREKFREEFESDAVELESTPRDQLMKKLMDILERHIDEPEFSIDHLTDELHMSRSQVYRKVTAITGYSPNEMIRTHRLKKAASLFRRGHRHVAQVMHRVGFNNQSYFSKCFSELYGMPPSSYINRKQV
jgi:DNA-binding response OmpR family regulator/two-component sensor histidine kinase